MGFKIPNYTEAVSAGVGDQAEPDSVDFQILGNPSNGVVFDLTNYATNGVVTKDSTPTNTVNVAPYKVIIDGVYYHNDSPSITVLLDGGDANKRFDLVVIPKATPLVPTFRKGTSSSTNPQFPTIVDGDVVLAAIYRAGSGAAGYIDTPNIVDKRLFISSNSTWINANEPTLVANSDGAKAANGDIWITTANAAFGKSNVWVKSAGTWENLAEYTAISSANTANNLVLRDASGNFSAGTITANLVGNVTGTVTGSSGSTTGNAATATNANNANTVANLAVHGGRNNEQNKVVRTDGSGYLQTGYINSDSGYNENINSSPDRIWGSNGGGDSYLRAYRTSALNVNSANAAISATSATYARYLYDPGTGYYWSMLPGNYWGTNAGVEASEFLATDNVSGSHFRAGGTYTYFGLSCLRVINSSEVYSQAVSGRTVLISPNLTLGTSVSSRKFKENIAEYTDLTKRILNVNPVTFDYKSEHIEEDSQDTRFNQFGLIAEDMHDAGLNHLVHYDKTDKPEAINYTMLAVELLGVIKQQETAITSLTARIEALEAQ